MNMPTIEEINDYIYSLPHSAIGGSRHYDNKSNEARIYDGVLHEWSYEEVIKIIKHFTENSNTDDRERIQQTTQIH